MHFNMILPGLEEVTVIKAEMNEGIYEIYIEMPVKTHICSSCLRETRRVHDYHIQRIKHLKMAERQTIIVYRKRRYACSCGTVKAKTFTEFAAQYHSSVSTINRRFDRLVPKALKK